jgi:hypothetical protein
MHDLGSLLVGLSQGQGHDYASRYRAQAAHEPAPRDVPNIRGNAARFVIHIWHTSVQRLRSRVSRATGEETGQKHTAHDSLRPHHRPPFVKNAACAQVAASGLEPHKPAAWTGSLHQTPFRGRSTYGRKALANRPTKSHQPDARASTKTERAALSHPAPTCQRSEPRFSNCHPGHPFWPTRDPRQIDSTAAQIFDARRLGYGVEKEHRTPSTRSGSDSRYNARAENNPRRLARAAPRRNQPQKAVADSVTSSEGRSCS